MKSSPNKNLPKKNTNHLNLRPKAAKIQRTPPHFFTNHYPNRITSAPATQNTAQTSSTLRWACQIKALWSIDQPSRNQGEQNCFSKTPSWRQKSLNTCWRFFNCKWRKCFPGCDFQIYFLAFKRVPDFLKKLSCFPMELLLTTLSRSSCNPKDFPQLLAIQK